jgi:hypothetical protein
LTRTKDDLPRLRAWWFGRQGLTTGSAPKTVADGVRRAGWLTTSGGVNVYLSLRARMPGVSREAIDRAALDGVDVIEVPGAHARPPVLVPRDDMALALRLHRDSYTTHAAAYFARAIFTEAALKAVAAQVCRALDEGPLSTGGIRPLLTHPDAGELLAGALVHLATRGIVRRYPADGRLDSSKYQYELRHPDDRPDLDAEGDAAAVAASAARLFLQRHGPATVDEMAEWAPLTKGALRKALAALGAEPIPIQGWTKEAWLLPEDVQAWKTFAANAARVVFLPYRDPFVARRRPPAVLAGDDRARVLNASSKPEAIGAAKKLTHHAIVSGGELVGVWEYDPGTTRIVSRVWSTEKGLRARVSDAAAETERFITRQLGDAGLSAVDPPAQRAKRLAFCGLPPTSTRARRPAARTS